MDSSYWPYIWIVILIALSAFFSGSEIAFAAANKTRLKKNAENGGRDRVAYDIAEHYDSALSAILIGNNLVNIAASSVATVVALSIFGQDSSKGPIIATAVMTVLILIFGEIVPKIAAKKNSDSFSVAVAWPLRLVMLVFKPVNAVVLWIVGLFERLWGKAKNSPTVTEEELASIIEIIEDEGVIDEEQSELLQSALEFSDITAQEILTPRVDMEAIDIDDPMEDVVRQVLDSPHSRIPVYKDTVDNIIGVLFIDHLLKRLVDEPQLASIDELLMPPVFVHKTMKLPALMSELKKHQTHLAVVLDEYGGTMGIVTMEDAVEQLVGEIWDETDEIESDITELAPNSYLISGDMSIYDFLEYFELSDHRFDTEYITVGGWAIEMLEGDPQKGESFDYKNLHITIHEVDDLRITKLAVDVGPRADEEEDE